MRVSTLAAKNILATNQINFIFNIFLSDVTSDLYDVEQDGEIIYAAHSRPQQKGTPSKKM